MSSIEYVIKYAKHDMKKNIIYQKESKDAELNFFMIISVLKVLMQY